MLSVCEGQLIIAINNKQLKLELVLTKQNINNILLNRINNYDKHIDTK